MSQDKVERILKDKKGEWISNREIAEIANLSIAGTNSNLCRLRRNYIIRGMGNIDKKDIRDNSGRLKGIAYKFTEDEE